VREFKASVSALILHRGEGKMKGMRSREEE
jgi:hypothetical protein